MEENKERIVKDDLAEMYYDEIKDFKLLTAEEEKELALLVHEGDEKAREKFIIHNLRWVVKKAAFYRGNGLEMIDLIQEGTLGLMKAVERFDPNMGYRFSTYASYWIDQAIRRAISKTGRTIRLPENICDEVIKLKKTKKSLEQELGRTPNIGELVAALEIDEERVTELMLWSDSIMSLDRPLDEDEETFLRDTIEDESGRTPEEEEHNEMWDQLLYEALKTLSDRECLVLTLRFGLGEEKEMSLEKIGRQLGITRERVRQIQAKALKKLASPQRLGKYKDFF